MKLYLWGGRNPSTIPTMKDLIKQIIQKEHITELLHIPFAGVGPRQRISSRCMPNEFQPFIESLGVRYLDASYKEDIEVSNGKYIYINWGHTREFLLAMCNQQELLEKIKNADLIVGESSGSMILGEITLNDTKTLFDQKGLGLVNNTIIQPHYNKEYNNKEELMSLYKEGHIKTGYQLLWIDETTFVEYENGNYGEIFWTGEVHHL